MRKWCKISDLQSLPFFSIYQSTNTSMCESDYIGLGYYELMLFSHHDVRSLPTRQRPNKIQGYCESQLDGSKTDKLQKKIFSRMTPHECMPLYELHKFKELSSWVNLRQQRSRNTMNFLLIMFHSHNGFTPGSSPTLLASIKHTLYAIPHCMFSAKIV